MPPVALATLVVMLSVLPKSAALAATPDPASRSRCMDTLAATSTLVDRTLSLAGNAEARIELPATARGADMLVYAVERGVDVVVDARDSSDVALALADNPVTRSGIQRMWLAASPRAPTQLVLRGREHAGVAGSVRVLVIGPGRATESGGASCVALERTLATADLAYASASARAAMRGEPATTVASTGSAASTRASLMVAAALYEKASTAFAGASRAGERGEAQLALAALNYYDLQEWSAAARFSEQAASTLGSSGNPYGQARAQAILASAWLEIATKASSAGQTSDTPRDSRALLDRARTLLGKLERFHADRGEPYDRALQINNIGLAYYNEARFDSAIDYYNRALAEFERLGETQRVAVALQNIALCEWGLGRLTAALPRFQRAVSLMAPQPYPDLYLATLYSSALAHYAGGRFDESLRLHAQSLDVATSLHLDRARARAYYGMGVTYYAIGDRDLSMRFLRSAVEMLTADVDARGRVAALRALAVIEHEMGDFAQASSHNSEALTLATAPSARARILLRLAADYAPQGRSDKALGMLNPLASSAPNGDLLVQALARAQRARLYRAAGNLDSARRDLEWSVTTLRTFEAVADEFDARLELARLEHEAGNDDRALATLTKALGLTRELTAQTANPEYRASIAQSVRPALDLKIDLLWDRYERMQGAHDTAGARATALESLRIADESRAVAFEQLRAQRFNSEEDPALAELQRKAAVLYRDIADRRFHLSAREDRTGSGAAGARVLREDIARLRARLGVVTAELAERAAPHEKQPAGRRADGISAVLAASPERAFVEYWVGADETYAWAIVGGQVHWQRLAASEQVERAARGLHDSMRSYAKTPVGDRMGRSAELHQLLIAPLASQLVNASQITFVPDGPLHYVPFAALRESSSTERRWLIERFAIALAPALRLISTRATSRSATWSRSRMLLVADPIYGADDQRLQRDARARSETSDPTRRNDLLRVRSGEDPSQLARLYSSAREADRIRALPGLGPVDRLEGFDATRANVLAQDFSAYRFIHFASHGIIDSEIPQLSALILGGWDRDGRVSDQYVRAGDLMGLTFDAEVVVLSACDTALGREFAGEGLIGLRYAALARGARSVVGSLWPVSDAIAADLMTDMYRYITAGGQQVEMALSNAIRTTLVRTPSLDPALWAPFAVYVSRN